MINRRRITNICDNCNICGLPVITCICNRIRKVETKSKFIILSSEREIYRNTNTANLLKLVNPESTEIIIWKKLSCRHTLIEISVCACIFMVLDTLKTPPSRLWINEQLKIDEVFVQCSHHNLINTHRLCRILHH